MRWKKYLSAGLQITLLTLAATVATADGNLLEKAVREGDLEAIRGFASSNTGADIDINSSDHTGKNALMVSAKAGDPVLVDLLLTQGADPHSTNNNGGTPLMFAAISGNVIIINQLLELDVEVNLRGSNGWGALMIAAAKGHEDATIVLLNAGADVNTRDVYHWTPLHRAAYENRIEIVKILLKHAEILPDAIDDQGATALHHAAAQGHSEVAIALLEQGAKSDKMDGEGRTPAQYALESGHQNLVELLGEMSTQVN